MAGHQRHHAGVRVSRRGLPRVLLAGATGLVTTAALLALSGPTAAQTGCTSYGAVATGEGVRTFTPGAGLSPTDVDGQGPAAQAQVDSVAGSSGWAGAPYSAAAA